jgi:hypothetical protein
LKLVSDGLALPELLRSPDSKPAKRALPTAPLTGASSRRRYCEKATTRGFS